VDNGAGNLALRVRCRDTTGGVIEKKKGMMLGKISEVSVWRPTGFLYADEH